MKICLLYIAVANGPRTHELAGRFVTTYLEHPPGYDHDLVVLCNGGELDPETQSLFSVLERVTLVVRSNVGFDIGGYIEAAQTFAKTYDWLICMGESVYSVREGWLARMAECFEAKGAGMFGPFSSNSVRAHLNTTMFATAPILLAKYPLPVRSTPERYEFEHGERCFWRWLRLMGKKSWLVTWDGCWQPQEWRSPNNILWRGDQSNLIMRCNHSDNFEASSFVVKASWQRHIDQAFR